MEVQKWSPYARGQETMSQGPSAVDQEADMELKRGPWTVDEDLVLADFIAKHGEGRWNSLARRAGLKRTGKSCRLRWLNYLRPDVRRGNITAEEQLLILELHSRWGNRWSKIAQYLPGRTDNEIKNYWRTRVQKHAKQLNCDVDSDKFKDAMRYLWMPRLLERIRAADASCGRSTGALSSASPMRADVQVPAAHSPLESSDVHDHAGSSIVTNVISSATGTALLRSPISSDSGCPAGSGVPTSVHDQALQEDAAWAESLLDCSGTVPEIPEDQNTYFRDQLQRQCDLGVDMFVDNFWSFEDVWSMVD